MLGFERSESGYKPPDNERFVDYKLA